MPISQQEAIDIAKQRVVRDAEMSLMGRVDVAEDEGAVWHVLFPVTDPDLLAGEPHVLVDKATGAVSEIYYTQ